MVQRLPTRDDLGGVPSGRSGRGIASANLTHEARAAGAMGAALEDLGRDIGGFGAMLEERERQRDEYEAQLAYQRKKNNDAEAFTQNVQNMQPGDREFAARHSNQLRQSNAAWLETLPKSLQNKYAVLLEAHAGNFDRAYDKAENDGLTFYHKSQLEELQNAAMQNVSNNPQLYNDLVADFEETIKAIPNDEMTPLQKEGHLKNFRSNLAVSKVGGDFRNNAKRTIDNLNMPMGGNTVAVSDFVEKAGFPKVFAAALVGRLMAESGGDLDPNARNPGDGRDGSDSIGIMQWNAGRARALKKYAENDGAGRPWNDRSLQAEFMIWEIFQNPDIARRAQNAQSTEEALKVVFDHIRPGGWVKGGDYTKINGFKETVANTQAILAGELGDAAYENIPFQDRQKLAAGYENEFAKQQKEIYTQNRDALDLAIANGEFTSMEEFQGSEEYLSLDDGDAAILTRRLQSQLGDTAVAQAVLSAMETGEGALNPFDPDQVKAANQAFDMLLQRTPENSVYEAAQDFAEATGVIPERVMNDIAYMANQTEDLGLAVQAYEQARSLREIAGPHFNSFTGRAAIREDLQVYDTLTGFNFTQEEAARHIADMRDPANQKTRKEVLAQPAVEKAIENIDADFISNKFDGWFSAEPTLGATVQGQLHMVAEYQTLFEETVVSLAATKMPMSDIVENAHQVALTRFSEKYDTSEMTLTGPDYIQARPPERTYGQVEGSHGWLRQQAFDTIVEELTGTDQEGLIPNSAEDVYFQPYLQTERDVQARRPDPRYILQWKDKTGALQQYSLPFSGEYPQTAAGRNPTAFKNWEENKSAKEGM